jgi:hypothetical protein
LEIITVDGPLVISKLPLEIIEVKLGVLFN